MANSIAAVVRKVMELIAMDSNGKRILDWLGTVMVQRAAPGRKTAEGMVRPVYEFVLEEQKRVN